MALLTRRVRCQELVELASDYLDGALSASAQRAVEHHLDGCPNCTNYLAQLRLTVELTGQIRSDDVPEELLDVLTRAWEDLHPDR
ncbi:MAG: anti-sigma factor [Kineosporiaceae bacterium]